jgi:pimeloyl-ACP methyl ester carboxylesterase
MAALYPVAATVVAGSPRGDGHPVIVLPGFFTGPNHTLLLRISLAAANYNAIDWGEGFNLGGSEQITRDLTKLLKLTHAKHGKVSLIGWSLGGLLARALANEHPNLIRNLITLGSPHRADPKKSKLAPVFDLLSPKKLGEMTDADLALVRKDPPVPITNIYTKSDEVVDWQDCLSDPAPNVRNVEVISSHLTLTHNIEALRVILDSLTR